MVHLKRLFPVAMVLALVVVLQGAANLIHNPHFTGAWSGSNSGINGGWSSLDSMSNVSSMRFLDLDVAYATPDTSGGALLAVTNADGGSATSVVASVYPLYSNSGSPYFGQPMTTNMASATTTNWEYQWTAQAGIDAYYVVATLNGSVCYTSVAPDVTKMVLTNFGGAQITADRWRLTTNSILVASDSNSLASIASLNAATNATRASIQAATNGLATLAELAGATNALSSTNQYWDVDVLTAPATSGSASWYDPMGGETFTQTEIEVVPIYSNAIGRVFGTAMTANHTESLSYHAYQWDAQASAVGYLIHIHINDDDSHHYREQAGTTIQVSASMGGSDITPKPSSLSRTNEIVSTWMVAGAEPGFVVDSSWTNRPGWSTTNLFVPWARTNDFATPAQLIAATSAIPVNPVIQSSNWTAYADPQFPVWSPPYFQTISTALYWLAQGPTGTRTNHAILKITGMHQLSGTTYTLNDDGLDFLSIDAAESTVWADVSQCSDVKGVVTLGSSVDHVQVKGGKWIGFQDSNKNGMALKLEGKYCGLVGVDGITEGSNWNSTSAITVGGYRGYMLGCMSRIGTNSTGAGNYSPLACESSTSLIMNCVFDFSQKPNSYFHLGQDQGKRGFQYIDCKFKFITSGTLALFSRVSANAKWINCVFANMTNTANQYPVIGRVGDVATTNFVINCVFNQANWFTNCIMISNNVSVADETTGFDGVLLTPPD